MRRVGKDPKSQMRHKADTALQKWGVKKYPKCEVCGTPTQCMHHLVEKSRSTRLRYSEENLVPVCFPCHTHIHNMMCGRLGNNSLRAYNILEKIFIRRGGDKFREELERKGRETINANMLYYQSARDYYEGELENL